MKNRLKVFVSVLMVLALLLSACGQKPVKAEELYRLVEEKTKAMDRLNASLKAEMEMEISLGEETQTETATVSGEIRGENLNTEKMRMAMPMAVEMPQLGMTVNTDTYYDDGWYLMEVMGQRVKCRMPLEDAIEKFKQENVQSFDYVRDLTVNKREDGLYTLSYSVDMDKALEVTESLAGGVFSGISENAENITWERCDCEIVADREGNPVSQAMDMRFSVDDENGSMKCDLKADYVYNEIGEDFSVEIPAADTFEEVDPAMLGLGEQNSPAQ